MDYQLMTSVGVGVAYMVVDFLRFSMIKDKNENYNLSNSIPMAIFIFVMVLIVMSMGSSSSGSTTTVRQNILTEPFDSPKLNTL